MVVGQFWYECAPPQVTHFCSTAFTEAGVAAKVLISFKFKASKSFTVEVISSLKEFRSILEEEEGGGGVCELTLDTEFRV